jgi:hypothetical protein
MNHPSTTLCAMLITTEKGNTQYLEMNHPVNEAGALDSEDICTEETV